MISEGIAYKNLLKVATNEQLLDLCEPKLREMLLTESTAENLLNEEQRQSVLKGAVDLSFACRDEAGKEVLFELIEARKQDNFVSDLSAFAKLDVIAEDAVLQYYKDNPLKLEKYLGWQQAASKDGSKAEGNLGPVTPRRGLRYYQLMGVRNVLSRLEEKSRCLYQAPTGAGKTRTAMAVVARHFMNHGPTKVLWLASTTELVDQACDAFRLEWEYKGDTEAVLYSWKGGGTPFNPEKANEKNTMLVASVQLLVQRDKAVSALKGDVSLIVFDEAHQSLAPTYQSILANLLDYEKCKLLGLSATPIRAESDKATQELVKMYGDNRIMIHSGNKNPIKFLVGGGFLAKTHFEKFDFPIPNMPKPKPDSDDYDKKLLDWLGKSVERNHAIANYVKKLVDQGRKRILVFTPTIISARYCALLLNALHRVRCYCISGDMDRSLRNRNIATFVSPEPEPIVIFNCQVLTTGFDAPMTDAVLVARPTKSPTLYAQMIGRALRGPKSEGTEDAYIYNFADQELEGYNDLVCLFETFEKSWS